MGFRVINGSKNQSIFRIFLLLCFIGTVKATGETIILTIEKLYEVKAETIF